MNSGGGAIFQGNVTAGRDVTINNFTEIRQVTERLSNRCSEADASDKLLGSLEALSGVAEFTEDYAKELNASVLSSDPLLVRVFRECASVLSELKRLENSLGAEGDGGYVFTASLNEDVMDVRSRLMSLQLHLSNVNSRRTAKDFDTIKEAVTQLMDSQSNSDDASSIRSFYTASSIPYVERQMWQEIEKSLRAHFTAEFVRDNYALIVASVEELVFENTTPWIEGASSDIRSAEVPSTENSGTTLPGSGDSNEVKEALSQDANVSSRVRVEDWYSVPHSSTPAERYPPKQYPPFPSLLPEYGDGRQNRVEDHKMTKEKLGAAWSESVGEGSGECLLTFGSYSSRHT